MKNTIILGMLMILGVACKGPEGGPGMEMTSCDAAKNEVREILTGESKSCSGLVKSAITVEEAQKTLETADKWISGNTIVAMKNGAFYTINLGEDGSILAFRGELELQKHEDHQDEEVHLITTIEEAVAAEGTARFNADGTLSLLTESGEQIFTKTNEALDITATDEEITVIRTLDELVEFSQNQM